MNVAAIREAESVTRIIAKWGSVVAALIFGTAFVTDKALTWGLVTGQAAHIGLTLAIFLGYALAWTERFEVQGSLLAVVSMIGMALIGLSPGYESPSPIFFAVGAPALFHLIAVLLHSYVLPRAKN